MIEQGRILLAWHLRVILIAPMLAVGLKAQQPLDISAIVHGVDASVKNRIDHLAAYTVTEHYAVFRGKDERHPTSEMLVRTTYRKQQGKSFEILSQSGSAFWRNEVLSTLLSNEKHMSLPGNVETALITSANYEMTLDAKGREQINGRDCLVLDITPRRASQFLIKGKVWVDARDFAIVLLKGRASKSAFFLASAAEVARQYDEVKGLPMATHVQAISNSSLLGQTVVKIDYTDYQVDVMTGS
jgi:hypothetical protein